MAEDYNDTLVEGRLDLVPMIDCIMLLLLFFILTSKFISPERGITALLPTDKGEAHPRLTTATTLPKTVNICIYPEGLYAGFQPSDYQAKLNDLRHQVGDVLPNAQVRIAGEPPLLVSGRALIIDRTRSIAVMADIGAYVDAALAAREDPVANRHDQPAVVITCFSGMSWKFAMVIYDAVRNYEKSKTPIPLGHGNDPIFAMDRSAIRSVEFAPPRVRNCDEHELGDELYDIVNMQ
jgi:biopolymer transport protein ExbD